MEINQIQFDSRAVEHGDMFVAVVGVTVDGHRFIDQAIASGAKVIVCEVLPEVVSDEITYLIVDNSAEALGVYANNFFDEPSKKLKLVGITGTNGKTTTATILHELFQHLGYQVGLLSTIENKINHKILDTKFTTPDALTINRLLDEMVEEGCDFCFMEVSSHAIEQGRVSGLHFEGAVFSNITHDHLDYHKTFDNYIRAKKKLFDNLPKTSFALTNKDDKRGMVMLQNCLANKNTYALNTMADFRARLVDNSFEGLLLEIDNKEVWFRLTGAFNAYNLLAIYATSVLLGENEEEVLKYLSMIQPAKGRFEQIVSKDNIRAIVDYAHTPDALKNVLETIREIRVPGENIITLVGCGGDRDAEKRPKMAAIAAKLSDKVVLTSDNPRSEDPEKIIEDMKKGIDISNARKCLSITDRREAIRTACMLAGPGDIVLVAGKGHEDYQEIKGVRHPFDDKKILEEILIGA